MNEQLYDFHYSVSNQKQITKEKNLLYTKEWKKSNPKKVQEQTKKARARYRELLFEILGGAKCSSCGFTDIRALQFDHIHGNGNRDRRHKKMGGTQMQLFYITHPLFALIELQVLCANCNWIKRHNNQETRKLLR